MSEFSNSNVQFSGSRPRKERREGPGSGIGVAVQTIASGDGKWL